MIKLLKRRKLFSFAIIYYMKNEDATTDYSVNESEISNIRPETKYRIVADNTYDCEFWLSPEGKFLYVSPSCKRITGYDVNEFMADSDLLYRIIHPDDLPAFVKHRRISEETESPDEVEFRIICPDGTNRW